MTAGSRPPTRTAHARAVPVWQPLEWPEGGLAAVPGLDLAHDSGRGRVIAVRATPGAREGGWAARAAIEIARAGVAQGARVLLADLFLDAPHLHEAFGAHNLEGVTDAVGYGASVGRIARSADEGAFWVATAGTPVADVDALFDNPGWRRWVEGLLEDGITLVAYQPAEMMVPPRGTPSIVLARKGEPMTALGSRGLKDAVAVRGPRRGPAAASAAAADGAVALGELGYRSSPWDEARDDVATEEVSPPDASGPEAEAAREPTLVADDQPVSEAAEQPPALAAGDPSPAVGEEESLSAEAVETPAAGTEEVPATGAVPTSEARADAGEDTVPGSAPRPRGRGLSATAFVILVLFAGTMILMGINNAGIAEVPGADRLWELFEGLLARISQFFAR